MINEVMNSSVKNRISTREKIRSYKYMSTYRSVMLSQHFIFWALDSPIENFPLIVERFSDTACARASSSSLDQFGFRFVAAIFVFGRRFETGN